MKVEYGDDIAYVRLRGHEIGKGEVARTVQVGPGVTVDLGAEGEVLGVEVLGVEVLGLRRRGLAQGMVQVESLAEGVPDPWREEQERTLAKALFDNHGGRQAKAR